MNLIRSDIDRIEAAGHRDFYLDTQDGRRLRNLNGRCVFLGEGGLCLIYRIRPKGCRLYPLAMRLPSFVPAMDEECPHSDEFPVDPDDVVELEGLVTEILEDGP